MFLDTSCLIAALHAQNDKHRACFEILRTVTQKKVVGGIAAHSLAEFFAVVTRLPGQLRVTPDQAERLIQQSILKNFEIVAADKQDYLKIGGDLARSRLGGGLVYDALILRCAEKADFDEIYTLNPRHFQVIPSAVTDRIRAP